MVGAKRGGIRSCWRLDVLCICFKAFQRVKVTFSVSSKGRVLGIGMEMSYEREREQEIGRPRLDWKFRSDEIAPILSQWAEQSEFSS